jgi:hypothetical protein
MSMVLSKLRTILSVTALLATAVIGTGCALDNEQTGDEPTAGRLVDDDLRAAVLDKAFGEDVSADASLPQIEFTRGKVTFEYFDGHPLVQKNCSWGFQGPTPTVFQPRRVNNGCSSRVWLYTGPNQSGAHLCMNPHTNMVNDLPRDEVWYYISSNTHSCP